ncbi:M23 family metallopeptidase [Deinococcus taeanensis]|uniref:M23 family metallopeptidase n=1 Tax=Deinococcus taeanensis TaxID=2737050 RepID=UPI003D81BC98
MLKVILGALPLDGTVLQTEHTRPDLRVPQVDSLRPAGNFIVLRSTAPDGRQVHILLAHLQRGSVTVKPGDQVRAGQVLALVGNSGNTTEPHLHLGVNINAAADDPFSGEGVPFSIAGHFPVRGTTFSEPALNAPTVHARQCATGEIRPGPERFPGPATSNSTRTAKER